MRAGNSENRRLQGLESGLVQESLVELTIYSAVCSVKAYDGEVLVRRVLSTIWITKFGCGIPASWRKAQL